MNKYRFLLPYAYWLVITFYIVEAEVINTYNELPVYLLVSFILAFAFEVFRSNKQEKKSELQVLKSKRFIFQNIVYGLPMVYYLFGLLMNIVLKAFLTPRSEERSPPTFDNIMSKAEIYWVTGYWAVWFLYNNLLIKPARIRSILLFLIAVLLLLVPLIICLLLIMISAD